MTASRRFLGPSLAFAVILLLGSGIYLKIRGSSDSDGDANEAAGDRPDVAATTSFGTGAALPVPGADGVPATLVIPVTASWHAAAWRRARV